MGDIEFRHLPIMAQEVYELLDIKPDGTYLDGTVGGGGHSLGILERIPNGRLIALDQDVEAIRAARERLGNGATFVNDTFFNIKEILSDLQVEGLDGALLDLGVSSYQLDNPSRGFSYRFDAPLDMRMNRENPLSAHEVVNSYPRDALIRILFEYGEERYAAKIADMIIRERPIDTTAQLCETVKRCYPPKVRFEGKHPAKRTFQAIRIEVNNELGGLRQAIEDFIDSLKSGGVLAVITFHSLEDRIVKNAFKERAMGCTCPKDFPVCVCGGGQGFKLLTKKAIVPRDAEQEENPRSQSAKLRGIMKI